MIDKSPFAIVQAEYDRLKALTPDQVQIEQTRIFEGLFLVTVQHLCSLAALVKLKEERGEDVRAIKAASLPYVRLIANGQLIPDLLATFGSSAGLMRRIKSLPIPDQQRLLSGDPLEVGCYQSHIWTHRLIAPLELSPAELRQVFGDGQIRSTEQQKRWIDGRDTGQRFHRRGDVSIDRKRHGVIIAGRFFHADELDQLALEARGKLKITT